MMQMLEPVDHALGRSRGGLSTKVHQVCDGKGRPMVIAVGPGQGSDSKMFRLPLANTEIIERDICTAALALLLPEKLESDLF